MMSVFRYDGISLITGFPVNVNTLSSGICDRIFTIRILSIRLYDKSKTDNLLHLINVSRHSIEFNKLCDTFNVFNSGNLDESQFSMHFMLLCDKFNVSSFGQCSKFSIFCKKKKKRKCKFHIWDEIESYLPE